MCLLYHVYRVKYIVHYKWFDGDPRPMAFYHSYYLINLAGNGQMKRVYCIRKQKETPFGVSFRFLNQRLPICSWLWVLCAPLGLKNLTPGTPRFTHLCASLRSFKDGSLGIPGRPARM